MKMEDGDKPRKSIEEEEDLPRERWSPRRSTEIVKPQKEKGCLDYGEESFTKEVEHYKIIGAKDPFHFWMVKESSEKKAIIFSRLRIFKKLQQVMEDQEFFRDENVSVHLEKYRLYLAFHERTQKWHRVRLLHFDKEMNSLLVYFVDYPVLELAHLPVDSLRDFPDEYLGYPVVPVYRAYLYDVTPRLLDYEWGEDCVEWFQRAIKNVSLWVGLQMTWKASWVVENGPDQRIEVGVVLFEDDDRPERSMSLNSRLVRLDHGRAIGIGATHFSNLYYPEAEPLFSLEHIPPLPKTDWCLGKLPLFVGNRWPQVVIRRVNGPNCIYVTVASKYKEYLAMQWKIEDIFKSGLPKINIDYLGIGLGCLVGFKNPRTGKMDIHRSVVVGVNGPKTVKVILVDVGEIKTVPVSTLYALPKRVRLIPAFVHRVHLNNIAPPAHGKWTSEMKEEFYKLVGEIGDGFDEGEGEPAWFAVRNDLPGFGDVINLREVGQDLDFDKEDKEWIAMSGTEGNWDNYRKQVLVKNYLHSFGVDLMVMRGKGRVEQEGELEWGLESLGERIVKDKERFQVERLGEKRDKEVYYDGLFRRKE